MKKPGIYLIPAIVVISVAAVAVYRSAEKDRFRKDASKWGTPVLEGSNMIDSTSALLSGNDILIVRIQSDAQTKAGEGSREISVSPDSLATLKYLRFIRKNEGPVVLTGTSDAILAASWMVLAQNGIRNLYILPSHSGSEVLKNEFRTVTMPGPEF